ncbi:MAG TPA: GxxExxY protein [Tepidisphaeraceae bacterium]|jgi:GxxExxY protein|nr:GxxExxY protein [Tepidisphaeraceae bacterium]
MLDEELTQAIIGACIEVHKHLGPGLLESAYQQCLCHELMLRRIHFSREVDLPVIYKGMKLDCAYRMDIVVEGRVLLELKSIEKPVPIHEAQLISYLKLSGIRIGLLINFNVKLLTEGIIRRVV